jgi:2-dehydro-3-deoxygluconokinase
MEPSDGVPAVLAVGETMALVTPSCAEPLETAQQFLLDIAGAESNVASHLVALGTPAAWAGAVGDDALGRRVLAMLAGRGVDVALARRDPQAPTGLFLKDPGNGVLYYRRGSAASRLGPEFADRLPLSTVPWVHLTGITPALSDSCLRLVEHVLGRRRALRLPVSFDVNYRPSLWQGRADAAVRLSQLAAQADLVFVGRDEAQTLWGTSTAEAVRARFPSVPALVVKDGPGPAHAFVGDRQVTVAPGPVEVVEPIGAGDAFAAGFLAARLDGATLAEALATGHRRAGAALATTADY